MTPDLSVDVAGVRLPTPVMAASGCFGFGRELRAFVDLADAPESLVRSGVPHGTAALVRLLIITAVALAIASSRLRRLKITGSAD